MLARQRPDRRQQVPGAQYPLLDCPLNRIDDLVHQRAGGAPTPFEIEFHCGYQYSPVPADQDSSLKNRTTVLGL